MSSRTVSQSFIHSTASLVGRTDYCSLHLTSLCPRPRVDSARLRITLDLESSVRQPTRREVQRGRQVQDPSPHTNQPYRHAAGTPNTTVLSYPVLSCNRHHFNWIPDYFLTLPLYFLVLLHPLLSSSAMHSCRLYHLSHSSLHPYSGTI